MPEKITNFDENYYSKIPPSEWEINPDFAKALLDEVSDFVISYNAQDFEGDEENNIENLPQLGSHLTLRLRSITAIKNYCREKKLRFPTNAEMQDLKKSAFRRIMSTLSSTRTKNN